MEKVSIIVPFYNVEPYIETCLDSLLRQTHSNLEILCIDDCSEDGSIDIVNARCSIDSRVRVITHTQNKGLGGARNTGVVAASGDYICFVDSDDYVAENYVERLYRALSEDAADVAVCGFSGFWESGEEQYQTVYQRETIDVEATKGNVFDIVSRIRGAAWMKMYRRRLLTENDIFQPEKRYYEGVTFWLKSVFHSRRISTIPDILYFYRQRPGSIMRSFSYKHIDDRFSFLGEIDDFFKSHMITVEGIDLHRAVTSVITNMMFHLYYGETLIQDFGMDATPEYENYFETELDRFSVQRSWGELPELYRDYKVKRDAKSPPIGNVKDAASAVFSVQEQLQRCESELACARDTLNNLRSSYSWRITAPLRKILDTLNR